MANKNRGEILIKLGSKKYVMRPSFQALCSIESEINKSIIDILINLSHSKLKILEIESIVRHGILSYDKNQSIDQENIGNLIYQEGLMNILPKIIEFLELAIGINKESKNGFGQ